MTKRPPNGTYAHTRLFVQSGGWDLHEFCGELIARGITQFACIKQGGDWSVSWHEHRPPNVATDYAEPA